MPTLREVEEAVEYFTFPLTDCELDKKIKVLHDLARSVLDADGFPEKKEHIDHSYARMCVLCNRNHTLDLCLAAHTKKCLEYEQRIKELEERK